MSAMMISLILLVVVIFPVALWGTVGNSKLYTLVAACTWVLFLVGIIIVHYYDTHEFSSALRLSIYYGIVGAFTLLMVRIRNII